MLLFGDQVALGISFLILIMAFMLWDYSRMATYLLITLALVGLVMIAIRPDASGAQDSKIVFFNTCLFGAFAILILLVLSKIASLESEGLRIKSGEVIPIHGCQA